jgi:hypothetical protein
MAKKLQLRGGTTAQHSSFTGALREVTVDTDKDVVVVHDNSTAGGIPSAKASDIANSANWDTAYTDRNKWDGGATGLTAGTARTSLGLGAIALRADIVDADVNASASIAWSKMATDALDTTVTKIKLKDYGDVTNIIGGTGGGTQDIDLTLGNSVTATVDTSTNTFTFSNPSATGTGCGFTLILTNGGSQTVAWPASVDWAAATAPTLTTSGRDILAFWTVDGGTIWYGFSPSLAAA